MKHHIYEWHDRLKFGKYKGQHLDEVFQNHPEYVQKCLEKKEHFHITIYTRKHLEDLIEGFQFSEKALKSDGNGRKEQPLENDERHNDQ